MKSLRGKFGIVRNGEHCFPVFDSREGAEANIEERKVEDVRFECDGWIPAGSAAKTRYWIEQIRGNVFYNPHLGYAIAVGMILIMLVTNLLYVVLRARAERWQK